jgi:hypothetical protein
MYFRCRIRHLINLKQLTLVYPNLGIMYVKLINKIAINYSPSLGSYNNIINNNYNNNYNNYYYYYNKNVST